MDFGGGELASAGSSDAFLAKYNAAGDHLWSRSFGSFDWDEGISVSADTSGSVFLTAACQGTMDFGGGDLIVAGVAPGICLAKFDANGGHLWSKHFQSTGSAWGNSVSSDPRGNVFLTGSFDDTVDFGGERFVSVGNSDAYVVKHDESGHHLWSKKVRFEQDRWRGLRFC
ncbi:MAG: hypothetical protein HY897_24480 [Deltaproteobacteria bacterium]|nr:hypothetical protein [Deltaproteobacteria bacterium]